MIDCEKAENYLKYKGEICNKHSTTCVGCPLFQGKDNISDTCYAMSYRDPKKAIDLMQKWVDENIHENIPETTVTKTSDMVWHPAHYTAGGIECIKAIEASMTPEEFRGYLKGCALKYLWRYRLKENPLLDLQKAQRYLEMLAEKLTEEADDNV